MYPESEKQHDRSITDDAGFALDPLILDDDWNNQPVSDSGVRKRRLEGEVLDMIDDALLLH